jgi:predicted transcriptional regulator
MYAANMSWKPVQRILYHLVEQGLLVNVFNTESRQSRIRYQITEKGKRALDYFENADAIMPLEDIYADD